MTKHEHTCIHKLWYICRHTCTYIHTHPYTATHTPTHSGPPTHPQACIIHTHTHTHTHAHTHTHTHARAHTHTHTHTHRTRNQARAEYCCHGYYLVFSSLVISIPCKQCQSFIIRQVLNSCQPDQTSCFSSYFLFVCK